jgi:hypothetical protein
VKIRPYPHKQKPKPLEGYGTIEALAERMGICKRTLYRMRAERYFKSWHQVNPRVTLYHLARCEREIRARCELET